MPSAASDPAFAVWITGLPASGKSTVTAALMRALKSRECEAVVLESDVLRRILTPTPHYDEAERRVFYGTMAGLGRLITAFGVPVIFDATAHRRAYREEARRQIPRFLEVWVDCPLSVCEFRDPKRIYRQARMGLATEVPGVQVAYEPPEFPDLVIHGDVEPSDEAAMRIVTLLEERGYIPGWIPIPTFGRSLCSNEFSFL